MRGRGTLLFYIGFQQVSQGATAEVVATSPVTFHRVCSQFLRYDGLDKLHEKG